MSSADSPSQQDEDRSHGNLLEAILKELRQIRGMLGRIAKLMGHNEEDEDWE